MHYELYAIIFFTKIIENALGTLRMIVVANGKKVLGAVLNGVISLIWIIITGLVIINVTQDPLKILFFVLGSIAGSYFGSLIEEKLALGNNMLMVMTSNDVSEVIANELRKSNYVVIATTGENKDIMHSILMVIIPRKKTQECVSLISSIDLKTTIISLNASMVFDKHVY